MSKNPDHELVKALEQIHSKALNVIASGKMDPITKEKIRQIAQEAFDISTQLRVEQKLTTKSLRERAMDIFLTLVRLIY